MNSQQRLGSIISAALSRDEHLFSGPWIRWNTLTVPERVVCICVLLSPLWWCLGWTYTFFLITIGIIVITKWKGESLNLKFPSSNVLFVFTFQVYRGIAPIIVSSDPSPSQFISLCLGVFISFIFWFIECNEIRVRTNVLGWALSVLAIEMFLFWLVFQVALGAPFFIPPRTILSQIMDKSERYIPGSGAGNYLIPYWPSDKLPGGLVRFSFFFPLPEDLALLSGLISLVALDLKQRYWRSTLFGGGIFLIFLSGTRSTWLILPVILIVRLLIVFKHRWGVSIILGLIGLVCFISMSFSPITNYLTDTYSLISDSAGNMRKDSTEVRSLIYQRTWEAIVEEPSDFIFGRGVPGSTVLPGYAPAKVGSHSFILGSLLYRLGIVGSLSFLGFWITYTLKLYQTRSQRPTCTLLTVAYLSLALISMDVSMVNYLLILIAMISNNISSLDYRKAYARINGKI